MFRFKQFTIQQEKSAMKVGTDGVLLGAWTPIREAKKILDVGTGTGLIALMLAQRFAKAHITAIEIDKEASQEAHQNFSNSPWANRLQLIHNSFDNQVFGHSFDLIVSNPPYYTDTVKTENKRSLARHVSCLSFELLLQKSVHLLSDHGCCTFVIPFKEEQEFVNLAKKVGLYPIKITRVKGRETSALKRSLLCFAKTEEECLQNELVIEKERHQYTEAYIKLTQAFYLKM
ncbi:tRNA1(Val) (adenine(37)-N6)-methyltransferase [Ochrovirga pacifica]|uniref:tRNA1(Val) (adenine(37)-N6)-methyltransferase n=1 Tax=Ochrovirga pacifica TaxID=1042376 RepID=UPI000255980F|nr:methyltransferase [Ochrovirga pacifica]